MIWQIPIEVSDALLVGTIGLVVVGGLLSGWSQSISIVPRIAAQGEESRWLRFVTWLGIWVITSSIFVAVVPTTDTLASIARTPQGFIWIVLLGTTITVAIGTLVR